VAKARCLINVKNQHVGRQGEFLDLIQQANCFTLCFIRFEEMWTNGGKIRILCDCRHRSFKNSKFRLRFVVDGLNLSKKNMGEFYVNQF
jgi:hypothetical protein